MNKLTTILLVLCVIGLFTTAFMLGEIKSEIQNAPVANNTTDGTANLTNKTNETVNTTLINATEYDSEETTEPGEEETSTDGTTNSHELYKSQFNQKDGEPKGMVLSEDYIGSTGASNGKELQEYMENNVPEDYK